MRTFLKISCIIIFWVAVFGSVDAMAETLKILGFIFLLICVIGNDKEPNDEQKKVPTDKLKF